MKSFINDLYEIPKFESYVFITAFVLSLTFVTYTTYELINSII